MVQLCLQYRDYQRHMERVHGVHKLLQQLAESPDFYVEMKWEFTSWLPFVSKICPSDNYKVWKSGSNVRIDTTLLGFDNFTWERGRRSYIFKLNGSNVATLLEVDNDNCQIYSETLDPSKPQPTISYLSPSGSAVAARLTSPIVTSYVDVDKISFERTKSGVWGWRNDRTDIVDNFTCKVFSASNVQFVTKTRTEHMSDEDKRKMKKQDSNRTPFETFLGSSSSSSSTITSSICRNPCHVTEEEYFSIHPSTTSSSASPTTSSSSSSSSSTSSSSAQQASFFSSSLFGATPNTTTNINNTNTNGNNISSHEVDGGGNNVKDIGRPIEQTCKIQKFKSRFWLCDSYPLSLPDQVVPIIDLMAANNTHFRKLKDFIALQLPAGFPVKIEIPVFHVLNARITFSNIFSRDVPAKGVMYIPGDQSGASGDACAIDDSVFAIPASYSVIGELHHERLQDEDDEFYQYAMRESLRQQQEMSSADNHLKRTQSNHTRIIS
ncbi:hypothetical protein HELRODRAFT_193502, partial [Helobdella robusta]|uniref:Ankyrin repeat domain-containing protein n=1 Tax=Helobdella robusta TaxID=6412 RepID=T1FV23_HELRO